MRERMRTIDGHAPARGDPVWRRNPLTGEIERGIVVGTRYARFPPSLAGGSMHRFAEICRCYGSEAGAMKNGGRR